MNTMTPEMESVLAEFCGMPWRTGDVWREHASMRHLLAQIAKEGWHCIIDCGNQTTVSIWPGGSPGQPLGKASDPDPEVALKLAIYAALEARNA